MTTAAWLRLGGCTAAILVLWLAVLPWIAAAPVVQRRIQFLEQRRIDPSAMFYTELEAMDDIRERMEGIRGRQFGRFWRTAVTPERRRGNANSSSPNERLNIREETVAMDPEGSAG